MVYSANSVGNVVPAGAAQNVKNENRSNEAHLASETPSADVGDGMLLARNPGGSRSTTDRAIQYRQRTPGGPAYQSPGVNNIVPFRGSVTSLSSQAQSNVRAWNNKLPGGALQTDGQVIRVRLPNGFAPVVGFDPRVNPGVHAEETLVVGRQNEIIRFPNAVALPGTNYTNADLVRLMQARGEVENGRPTQKNTVALDMEKQKYESAYAQSRNSQSNPVQGPEAPYRDPRVPDLTLDTRQGYQGRTVQPAQYGNPVPKAQPITNPEIAKYPGNSQLVTDLVQLGLKPTLKPIIGKGAQQLDSGGSVEVRRGGRNYVDIKLSYPEGSLTYNFPVKPDGSPDIGNLPKNVEKIINDTPKNTNNDQKIITPAKQPATQIKAPEEEPITNPMINKAKDNSPVVIDLVQLGLEPTLKPRIGKGPQQLDSGGIADVRPGGRNYLEVILSYPIGSVSYNFPVAPNGRPDIGNLPKNVERIINDTPKNTGNDEKITTPVKQPVTKQPATEIKALENHEINGSLPRNVLQDLQYYATRPNLRATAKAGQPAPSGAQTTFQDLGSAIKLTMPYRGKTYTYNMGVNPNGSVDKNNLPEALKSPPLITDVIGNQAGNQAGKLPSTTEIQRFKNPFRKQEPLTKLLNNITKIEDPKKASQAIENIPGDTKKNQAPNNFSCEATITRIHGVAQNGKDYVGFVSVDVRPYINFPDGTRKIDNTALAGVTMRNDIKNGPLNDYKFQVRLDTIKGPGYGTVPYASNELSYVDGIKQYANSRGLSNLLGNANRYAAEGSKVDKNGFPIPFVAANTTKKTEYNSRIHFGRVVSEQQSNLSPTGLREALNGTISLPSKNVTIATETASLGGVQDVIRKIPYTFSNVKIDEANNYMFNNTTNKVKAFCVCTGTAGKPVKVEANFTTDSAPDKASILTGRVDNNPRSRPFGQIDGVKWPAALFDGWR